MAEKSPVIDVAVGVSDAETSLLITTALDNQVDVGNVKAYSDLDEMRKAIQSARFNAVLIDIFSLGIEESLAFISQIRKSHPAIPFCLLGTQAQLVAFPGVPKEWKARFLHYYSLPIDQVPKGFFFGVNRVVGQLSSYWLARTARVRLGDLRRIVISGADFSKSISQEKIEEINQIVDVAEKALTEREKISREIIPSFETSDVQELIKETLKSSSMALDKTAFTNKLVLYFGLGLLAVSFVVSAITDNLSIMAFGGFGIAGVVASLITNPLKSIGMGARRIIQIQMAYFSFLNQLSLLNTMETKDSSSILEKSKQLDLITKSLQESLEKHFGI